LRGTANNGKPLRAPDRLLVATVGTQWLVTAVVALTASRSESVYGNAPAARATVDAAHAVAQGTLPSTAGPLYPLLLAPLAALTTRLGAVASVVTTLDVVLLAPLASYCLLEIARRVAGRPFAIAAAAVWLLGPLAAIPLFFEKYRDTYVDGVLPAFYGLTLEPVYLAMVLSLAAALFALRAADGAERAAFVAGLLAAAAIACVPVSAGVAVGVLLALVAAARWRGVLEAAVGLAAGLAPTLVWRHRVGEPTLTLGDPTWKGFQGSMASVREYFWSNRLLQWLPVAGAIGMARLLVPAAALLAGWVGTTAVVAVATPTSFDSGRVFVHLIPAWPAYALLLAAIPALVPTLVRRLGSLLDGERRAPGVSRAAAGAVFALTVVLTAALASLVGR
jgi:hypothetical protein